MMSKLKVEYFIQREMCLYWGALIYFIFTFDLEG